MMSQTLHIINSNNHYGKRDAGSGKHTRRRGSKSKVSSVQQYHQQDDQTMDAYEINRYADTAITYMSSGSSLGLEENESYDVMPDIQETSVEESIKAQRDTLTEEMLIRNNYYDSMYKEYNQSYPQRMKDRNLSMVSMKSDPDTVSLVGLQYAGSSAVLGAAGEQDLSGFPKSAYGSLDDDDWHVFGRKRKKEPKDCFCIVS